MKLKIYLAFVLFLIQDYILKIYIKSYKDAFINNICKK